MSIAQKVLNEKTIKEKLDINYVMVIKGFLITYSLRYPGGRENKEEERTTMLKSILAVFSNVNHFLVFVRNQCDR
jgi:hypothetical protein